MLPEAEAAFDQRSGRCERVAGARVIATPWMVAMTRVSLTRGARR